MNKQYYSPTPNPQPRYGLNDTFGGNPHSQLNCTMRTASPVPRCNTPLSFSQPQLQSKFTFTQNKPAQTFSFPPVVFQPP
jgi:hypothetical protein